MNEFSLRLSGLRNDMENRLKSLAERTGGTVRFQWYWDEDDVDIDDELSNEAVSYVDLPGQLISNDYTGEGNYYYVTGFSVRGNLITFTILDEENDNEDAVSDLSIETLQEILLFMSDLNAYDDGQ